VRFLFADDLSAARKRALTSAYVVESSRAMQRGKSMAILDLKLKVPDEIAGYLLDEADRRQVTLDVVVSEILADHFEDLNDLQILADIKIGLQEAIAVDGHPARKGLAEAKHGTLPNAIES
jgi:hypothetical protein